MTNATVTSKGQVTIPKEIREYLKLDTGCKVDFVIDELGEVKVIPLTVAVTTLSGILYSPGIKAATIEDMEQAISEGAGDWS